MNTKLAALASVLVATAALASAAEAGGGVRLGFGGPLGTFTATPAHGGGAYHRPKMKRKPAALEAARKPVKTTRIAKAKADTPPARKPIHKTTEPVAEEAPPVTGSSALIQGAIQPNEPPAATPETPAPDVNAGAAPQDATPAATADAEKPDDESAGCKRFIPAVGMTVSVGCDE